MDRGAWRAAAHTCTHHTSCIFFIYLGCFLILTFAGNMAMHKGHRYVFEILIPFPSDIHPEVGLLGHMVGLF